MKFCNHCGAQCKDSAMFCTTCGHKLNEAAPPQPNVPPQQSVPPQPNVPPQQNVPPQSNVPPQYSAPPQPNMPPYQAPQYHVPVKPVASTVRTAFLQMLESPALIVATIFLSCSVVLTFISVCMSNWVSVFQLIPAIVGLVGLWMLFSSVQGTKGRGTPISLASFPVFKISMIVSIVANIIYVLVMDILLIIGMAVLGEEMRYYRGLGVMMATLIIMLVLLTAYQILAIMYYVKGMGVVSNLRMSLELGQQPRLLSKYFIVISYILGIAGALGGIAMLVISCIAQGELRWYGIWVAPMVLNFLALIASAGFYIMIGMYLSKLNHSYTFASYQQQQNRPQ